jgi:putative glycosyltransferase (TIGR04372 family)
MKAILPFLARVVGFCLIGLLYLIEPFWRIRIAHLGVDRIGHLAFSLHILAANRKLHGPPPRTTEVLLAGNPCNNQLLRMWKRVLPLIDNRVLSSLWHHNKPLLARTPFHIVHDHNCQNHTELSAFGSFLPFTPDEEKKGHALLRSMGIGENDWWVCMMARDSSYSWARLPESDKKKWTYQQFAAHSKIHHSDMDTFMPAAMEIVERGGFVLRMGAKVEAPLESPHPRIIDYATLHRSDFGDIYLAAKAKFYLGGSTGFPFVCMVFDVPTCIVNVAPVYPTDLRKRDYYAPTLIREIRSGRILHYSECHAMGMFDIAPGRIWKSTPHYERAGVEPIFLPPDDILAICRDMFNLCEGIPPTAEAITVQEHFRHAYTQHISSWRDAPAIAPSFALKYRHLIEA